MSFILIILALIFGSPMVLIIGLFCLAEDGAASDWEQSERNAERRHRELMEIKKKKSVTKRTTRHIARDEHGRFIAEEIIEEGDNL